MRSSTPSSASNFRAQIVSYAESDARPSTVQRMYHNYPTNMISDVTHVSKYRRRNRSQARSAVSDKCSGSSAYSLPQNALSCANPTVYVAPP